MSGHGGGGGHGKPKKPAGGGHGGGHGGGGSIPGWQLAVLGIIAIILLVMFYTGQIGPSMPVEY